MTFKGTINYLMYKVLPEKTYLKIAYYRYHKELLNIKKPKTFTEKLFLMKLYNKYMYGDSICDYYDKVRVRKYVETTIGEKYLTKLYGVWDNAEDIVFENLPEKCIFKITQSSGLNRICLKGYKSDAKEIRMQLQRWLEFQKNKKKVEKINLIENYIVDGNAKIMCEELLELSNNEIPEDIRIYCFNGIPEFITIDYDSVSSSGEKLHEYSRNVYDLNGVFLPYKFGRENNPKYKFPNISNLEEMIEVAKKLSAPFMFVRVDLYNVNGRIVFGELTWIPQGGAGEIYPYEFNLYLGNKLDKITKELHA